MESHELQWLAPAVRDLGFAALGWYLIVRHIPAIERRHAQERNQWLQSLRRRDEIFERNATANLEALSQILIAIKSLEERINGTNGRR